MKALVTGATGFVGPHLIEHLRACGDQVVLPGDASGTFDITDRATVHDVFDAHMVVGHVDEPGRERAFETRDLQFARDLREQISVQPNRELVRVAAVAERAIDHERFL